MQQRVELDDGGAPGCVKSQQSRLNGLVHLRGLARLGWAIGNFFECCLQGAGLLAQRRARGLQCQTELGRTCGQGLVIVGFHARQYCVQAADQSQQLRRLVLAWLRRAPVVHKVLRVVQHLQQLGKAQHHQ